MTEQGMKPIWYFVGLLLLVIGTLILTTGIYQLLSPPSTHTVLGETHPDLWWGAIMVLFGGFMYLKTRKQSV